MGGLIGFERQAHGRPAGFRTHILVCVSSVLLMLVSEHNQAADALDPSFVRVDPGRLAAGAMTGIGFLGAGVILKSGATVTGLTTAACIWMVAAIGLSIGAGMYMAGSVAFVVTIATLFILRVLEGRMPRVSYRTVSVSATRGFDEAEIDRIVRKHCLMSYNVEYETDLVARESNCRATVAMKRETRPKALLDDLAALEGVTKVAVKG